MSAESLPYGDRAATSGTVYNCILLKSEHHLITELKMFKVGNIFVRCIKNS